MKCILNLIQFNIFFLFLLFQNVLAAPTAFLVKDINTTPGTPFKGSVISVGNIGFFVAYTERYGYELWRTDGTKENTYLVKDIFPGKASSTPQNLTNVNGTLYFSANTFQQNENKTVGNWWRSDGTEAGTFQVASNPESDPTTFKANFLAPNSPLFFSGNQLWRVNNTASPSITLVKEFSSIYNRPNIGFSLINDSALISVFESKGSYTANNTYELWISDGTPDGTFILENTSSTPTGIVQKTINVNGVIYFTENLSDKCSLWKVNGTEVSRVKKFDSSGSSKCMLTKVNRTLLIGIDYLFGKSKLWKSDGTEQGTSVIPLVNSPEQFTNTGDLIFFASRNYFQSFSRDSRSKLWVSNGTSEGTRLLKEHSSLPKQLTMVDGLLYYTTSDGLWKSNGTEAGTTLVKSIPNNATPNRRRDILAQLTLAHFNINHQFYFCLNREESGVLLRELWRSDGTQEGTELVKVIENPSRTYQQPFSSNLISANNLALFFTKDGTHGIQLWSAGEEMQLLTDNIPTRTASSSPLGLFNVNGTLLFFAADGSHWAIWKSNGTANSSSLVHRFSTWSVQESLHGAEIINNKLHFEFMKQTDEGYGGEPIYGYEYWITDGTPLGTKKITTRKSPALPYFDRFSNSEGFLNNIRFFRKYDAVSGTELWQSNSEGLNPLLFKDILPGPAGSHPTNFTKVGDKLFFTATDEKHGTELWVIVDTNSPPIADNDEYTLEADTTLYVSSPGVLNNDADPDGDSLSAVLNTNVSHGLLTFNKNGSFAYTPISGYSGIDSFTYSNTDGKLNSGIATVKLIIKRVSPANIAGDFDSDNDVDKKDLTMMKKRFGHQAANMDDPYDINKDGVINVLDFRRAIRLCTRSRCSTE